MNDLIWGKIIDVVSVMPVWDLAAHRNEALSAISMAKKQVGDIFNPFGFAPFGLYAVAPSNHNNNVINGRKVSPITLKSNVDWDLSYAQHQRFDVLAWACKALAVEFREQIADRQAGILVQQKAIKLPSTITSINDVMINCTDAMVELGMMADVRRCTLEIENLDHEHDQLHPRVIEVGTAKDLLLDGVWFHESPGISKIHEQITGENFPIFVALDLSKRDNLLTTFENCCVFPDVGLPTQRQGLYGWLNVGFVCFDINCVKVCTEVNLRTKQIVHNNCDCGSPLCTWRGSFHCRHG